MVKFTIQIVLTLMLSGAECLIPDFLRSDVFNIYRHAAVETREIQHRPVEPENVTYYLFTSENPFNYVKFDQRNLNVLANKSDKIVFFIHGWTNSREIEWYEDLKNAFLINYKNYSVVQVDWKEPANQFYYVSSINTYDVAKFLADLIVDLTINKNYGYTLDDILLVGHSLGGQITGFIGKHIIKQTGRKLPRIIALDPAGPLFTVRPDDKRLNKNDADIVEVIHSDGGTFGFLNACGTIDFFPNGGSSQPGCKRIDLLDLYSLVDPVSCDHRRAYHYFVEAILNPKELLATKCVDWTHFQEKKCDEVQIAMGDLTTRMTGLFYLETNKDKPFSKKGTTDSGFGLMKVLNRPSLMDAASDIGISNVLGILR